MLNCQSHLFDLDDDICYLNGAYMSPQLKKITATAQEAVKLKSRPYQFTIDDFFQPVKQVKERFARLIGVDQAERVAIIPSVSYGLANVANNLQLSENHNVIVVDEQFPSNYYSWKTVVDQAGATIRVVSPKNIKERTKDWNEEILNSIDENTALVAIGHIHWADGTIFDLKKIRAKTREVGALLVIDGTQSVGALPFSVKEFEVDALICGGYKWLLGPYSLGIAYYGAAFDNGTPIEENWINRHNSRDFKGLVAYEDRYRPFANRYSVGEQSNFIQLPMLTAALEQLLEWGVDNIQNYCKSISRSSAEKLRAMGCLIEAEDDRCGHLFGIRFPKNMDVDELRTVFAKEKVYVSFRGDAMRVSPNIYNKEADFEHLVACFEQVMKK